MASSSISIRSAISVLVREIPLEGLAQDVLFIIATGFSLAVRHIASINYHVRLNKIDMQIKYSSKQNLK